MVQYKINPRSKFLNKHWYEKGVRQISDIIDENGKLYQFNKFKEVYGVRGTFLDYHLLISKIPME